MQVLPDMKEPTPELLAKVEEFYQEFTEADVVEIEEENLNRNMIHVTIAYHTTAEQLITEKRNRLLEPGILFSLQGAQ